MIVYIDANKYLQFFRAQDEPLTSLNLLRRYLKRQKITLLFPRVTQDEFFRNLDSVQATYIATLKKLEVTAPKFASVVRDEKRKKKIQKHLGVIKDELKLLETDYLKKSKALVERDIQYLINNSLSPDVDDEIFNRAKKRRLIGNPPGKSDTAFHIGDEIVWETILRDAINDDVVIISNDGDWANPSDSKNNKKISEFLRREWVAKTDKTITLETSLGKFINEHFAITEKVSEDEIKKEEAIQDGPSSALYSPSGWGETWGVRTWPGGTFGQNTIGSFGSNLSSLSEAASLGEAVTYSAFSAQWSCPRCQTQMSNINDVCIACGFNRLSDISPLY